MIRSGERVSSAAWWYETHIHTERERERERVNQQLFFHPLNGRTLRAAVCSCFGYRPVISLSRVICQKLICIYRLVIRKCLLTWRHPSWPSRWRVVLICVYLLKLNLFIRRRRTNKQAVHMQSSSSLMEKWTSEPLEIHMERKNQWKIHLTIEESLKMSHYFSRSLAPLISPIKAIWTFVRWDEFSINNLTVERFHVDIDRDESNMIVERRTPLTQMEW